MSIRRTNRSTRAGAMREAAVLTAVGVVLLAGAGEDDPSWTADPAASAVPGFTAPFRQAVLSVQRSGKVAAFPVEEGQTVHKGDLLVQLDDRAQRVRTDIAHLKAASELDAELARVRMQAAEANLERLTNLGGDALASVKEIADAKAQAAMMRVSYEQARLLHQQNQLDYQLQQQLLDQLSLRAPFDGYIAERMKEEGETAEEGEGIVRLVQLDPLLVVLDVPIALTGEIHAGDRLTVRPADGRWSARPGTVIFVSAVAHAASQMQRVKLVVDNADRGWLSGMKVSVDPREAAHARAAPPATALTARDAQGH